MQTDTKVSTNSLMNCSKLSTPSWESMESWEHRWSQPLLHGPHCLLVKKPGGRKEWRKPPTVGVFLLPWDGTAEGENNSYLDAFPSGIMS